MVPLPESITGRLLRERVRAVRVASLVFGNGEVRFPTRELDQIDYGRAPRQLVRNVHPPRITVGP